MFNNQATSESGQLTLAVLLFSFVAIIILSGLIIWVDVNLKSAYRSIHRDSAFRIAEAGIEYYRWHLAHAPLDFKDGTGQAGPYTHNFRDKSGNIIGKFKLEITPPPLGSTVVTIRSTGTVEGVSGLEKSIEIKMAKPSFAKYAVVLNDNVRFGPGTNVFGQIHSNGGIRFDGLAHNIVTSAVPQYDDPDHSGSNEFGVHTHIAPIDPIPPAAVPSRTDVFMAGRQFPVPAVDFTGITQSLSQIKTGAQASGRYFGPSGSKGYDIVLKTNDTFDVYKVTALTSPLGGCSNSLNQLGWGTWSISTETLLGNYTIPANGLIFIEDHAWVRGQINTARATIASGKFPDNSNTRTSITVNKDLLYTNYDGQDILSLIAQNNLNIGLVSNNVLRVDAAIIAQNGRVGRYYYSSSCGSNYVRSTITSYGMIGSYQRYGFAYTDNTGYTTRNLIYDSYLLYGPPPSFPLTSDYYEQIFWNEVK